MPSVARGGSGGMMCPPRPGQLDLAELGHLKHLRDELLQGQQAKQDGVGPRAGKARDPRMAHHGVERPAGGVQVHGGPGQLDARPHGLVQQQGIQHPSVSRQVRGVGSRRRSSAVGVGGATFTAAATATARIDLQCSPVWMTRLIFPLNTHFPCTKARCAVCVCLK
jgi:hypothetical protein